MTVKTQIMVFSSLLVWYTQTHKHTNTFHLQIKFSSLTICLRQQKIHEDFSLIKLILCLPF